MDLKRVDLKRVDLKRVGMTRPEPRRIASKISTESKLEVIIIAVGECRPERKP